MNNKDFTISKIKDTILKLEELSKKNGFIVCTTNKRYVHVGNEKGLNNTSLGIYGTYSPIIFNDRKEAEKQATALNKLRYNNENELNKYEFTTKSIADYTRENISETKAVLEFIMEQNG